ncbi:hypothetical protein ACHQM5_022147 [Ranunculus cassubicifolius]
MEEPREIELPVSSSALEISQESDSINRVFLPTGVSTTIHPPIPRHRHYKWWILVSTYTILVLVSQTGATLLGRLYFNNGGNSKWMATIFQSAGFPVLIPLLIYFSARPITPTQNPSDNINSPSFVKLALIYFLFGAFGCGNNLLYTYGTSFLPVSTYSLICATQLAFNAIFSYFLNSLKFTPYILNSLVLLTTSAVVLGIQGEPSPSHSNIPKDKHIAGFICTVSASALYSLTLSLTQVFFEKVRKKETFSVILEMAFFDTLVATFVSICGLFVSGEWKGIKGEMEVFTSGKVSYIMTLVWIAILWQVFFISTLGLIHEASSLFSNVVSTVWLPVTPILAVLLFRDKMDGMKIIAMFLAMWGFVSYVYEHYLDYSKSKILIKSVPSMSAC